MNQDFIQFLKEGFKGEVREDLFTKRAYSVDASIFEIEPLAVATPKDLNDLKKCVQACQQFNIPLIARGAATGIAGGCIGRGLIVDLSKYINRIIEINYDQEYAVCEPGVVQDELNSALSAKGYRLGPDTSTGDRATIGGMLANNSAGARSLRFGKMSDHVEEVELLLADGTLLNFGRLVIDRLEEKQAKVGIEGKIYQAIGKIRDEYREEIESRLPKIPRRVSGYNLDMLLKDTSINISKLIAGSEGTLGIATKIKMRIVKKPKNTTILLLFFDEMAAAMRTIPLILAHSPLSFEMLDRKILSAAKHSPTLGQKIQWLKKDTEVIFIVEMDGTSTDEAKQKLSTISAELNQIPSLLIEDPLAMASVWEVRKAGLGLLLSKRSFSRAIAFIEDLSIPPENLPSFMIKFLAYLKSIGKEAGIYGHVGAGCMHIRPYMDLRQPSEIARMQSMMEEISTLVLEHGGALSGEHGDGLVRSWLNPKMFGKKIYEAFLLIKNAFDPARLMNPGKIVEAPPLNRDLRAVYNQVKIETFLDFSKEGGFLLAADLCNGNALCRKSEKLMCPSFQATKDEFDSTRARAQALRAIINGKVPLDELHGDKLQGIMDLCLSCKGCKAECPSQVDMAKMKAETLYQYKKVHGSSFRDYLFGFIGQFNRYTFFYRRIFNVIISWPVVRLCLDKLGIAKERPLPKIADERFSKTAKKAFQDPGSIKKSIVLFSDTFTEFNSPKIGQDALTVLSALGYHVEVPSWECCGRTQLSKGFLESAKKQAEKLIEKLFHFAEQGKLIVVLEPSCLSAIKDDYEALFSAKDKRLKEKLRLVCRHVISFEDLLVKHIANGKLPFVKNALKEPVIFHTHCHQKALYGSKNLMTALKALGCENATETQAGCCGLAGSFGYEKEHFALSMKIGSLKLFPTINKESEKVWINANGTSCRHQIEFGTSKQARHIAELAAMTLS